ncbi:MAG: hypothetical protein ACR2HC_04970, partial [Thermoleophilaceae bacterium]
KSLYLLYLWLASAIAAQYLSERKGYGEKPGLVTGLLVSFLAVIIWLVWPAKKDSRWKLQGAFGKGDGRTVAQMRADNTSEEGG